MCMCLCAGKIGKLAGEESKEWGKYMVNQVHGGYQGEKRGSNGGRDIKGNETAPENPYGTSTFSIFIRKCALPKLRTRTFDTIESYYILCLYNHIIFQEEYRYL